MMLNSPLNFPTVKRINFLSPFSESAENVALKKKLETIENGRGGSGGQKYDSVLVTK